MTLEVTPRKALAWGAAWTIAQRWSLRVIGFVSTVVMARLLLPADYGIVAMAYLIVGAIQAFVEHGPGIALLRKDKLSPDEINSAWTLRLIQSIVGGLLLIGIAPVAASYFEEPRVTTVIWTLTICVLLVGVGNIGSILAHKEFNFALDFKIGIVSKLVSVVAAIAVGFWLRDYRALVVSIVLGFVSGAVLSYVLHPYRPKWCVREVASIWAVSKWSMLGGMGGFLLGKSDELLAARVGTTKEFGLYNVGADLGQLPTAEIGPAMLKALLPVLASLKGTADETNAAVLKTMAVLNAITLPVGFGFAALAVPATQLILGSEWAGAVQFVAAFAVISSLKIMLKPLDTLMVVNGFTKIQTLAVFIEFVVFLVLALIWVPGYHLMGLVWARLGACIFNNLIIALVAQKKCGVPLFEVFKVVARPAISALFMYGLVDTSISVVNGELAQILGGVLIGTVTYLTAMALTWHMSRRPPGLESTLLEVLPGLLVQLRSKRQ